MIWLSGLWSHNLEKAYKSIGYNKRFQLIKLLFSFSGVKLCLLNVLSQRNNQQEIFSFEQLQ